MLRMPGHIRKGMKTMEITTEQFDRLPKWAQQEIKTLTDKVDSLQAWRQRQLDPSTSPVIAVDHIHGDTGIPSNQVRFKLNDRNDTQSETIEVVLEHSPADHRYELEIRSPGGEPLQIIPRGSNSIYIWIESHFAAAQRRQS